MSEEKAHEIGTKKRECKTLACAIQACLKRKNFDENKCRSEIANWQRCFEELTKLERANETEDGNSSLL